MTTKAHSQSRCAFYQCCFSPNATPSCLSALNSTWQGALLADSQPAGPTLRHVRRFSCTSASWVYVGFLRILSDEHLRLASLARKNSVMAHMRSAWKHMLAEPLRIQPCTLPKFAQPMCKRAAKDGEDACEGLGDASREKSRTSLLPLRARLGREGVGVGPTYADGHRPNGLCATGHHGRSLASHA